MLIADDEPVILEGISKLLDYNKLGIEVAGLFSDGESLIEALETNPCDIIISDVAMPKMNGIEMLKKINATEKNIAVIFISGFSQFEYARDALRYGAVDYLTKPVKNAELENALKKAIKKISGKDISSEDDISTYSIKNIDKNYIEDKFEGDFDKYCVMNVCINQSDTFSSYELFQVSIAEKIERMLKNETIVFIKGKYICVVVGINNNTPISPKETARELYNNILEETGQTIIILISDIVDKTELIPEAYQKAKELEQYIYYSKDNIITYDFSQRRPNGGGNLEELEDKLRHDLIGGDKEKFNYDIYEIAKAVNAATYGNEKLTKSYFISIIKMMKHKSREYMPPKSSEFHKESEDAENKILLSEKFADGYAVFKECLCNIMDSLSSENTLIPTQITIIKDYIEEHYGENITLETLADTVFMNSFYLSAFIKKHIGINFKTYLDNVRLENAVKLLVSTNKRISEIAMLTGFKDARNFNNRFKKRYGKLPADFRKNR